MISKEISIASEVRGKEIAFEVLKIGLDLAFR